MCCSSSLLLVFTATGQGVKDVAVQQDLIEIFSLFYVVLIQEFVVFSFAKNSSNARVDQQTPCRGLLRETPSLQGSAKWWVHDW